MAHDFWHQAINRFSPALSLQSRIPNNVLRIIVAAVWCALLSGCIPKAPALQGAVAPNRLPAAQLPPVHQRVIFDWRVSDGLFSTSGEGAVRIAPPDSARLDLFLSGGFGSAHAILIGDTLYSPGGERVRQMLPPPAMLWAGIGRLAVPPAADTTTRANGDTLRADIGRDPVWRVTFVQDRIARLERIEGGRVVEWIDRAANGNVDYEHEQGRRSLRMRITRADEVSEFDASIWRR